MRCSKRHATLKTALGPAMAALLAVLQAAQSLEERFTYGSLRFISRVFGVVKPLEGVRS